MVVAGSALERSDPTFEPERTIPPGNGMMTPGSCRMATTAASAVQTQAQHATDVAKGAASAVTPGHTRLEEPDDVTLARKVETHIFRAHDAPKGTVSVDVQAGVAYLRGVAAPEWIDRLAAEARQVEGISGVKNLLHTPGTPTPAAEPRFLAAQHFHRS